jgi:hypothetical protein
VCGGDNLGGDNLGGDKLLLQDGVVENGSLHISILDRCCLCFSIIGRGLLTIVGVTAQTFFPNDRELGREIFSSNGGAKSVLGSFEGCSTNDGLRSGATSRFPFCFICKRCLLRGEVGAPFSNKSNASELVIFLDVGTEHFGRLVFTVKGRVILVLGKSLFPCFESLKV